MLGMGVRNTYCIIFVLCLVLFLAPMQQASAVFFLPPEWTEEELLELFKQKQLLRVELQNEENFDFESYKQEQLFRAEQVRDQILDFKMTGLQNPYHDIKVEVIITYEGNVENDESILASFVDPSKNPQHYLDRYYNEPIYKEWFDKNFPGLTIEKAVGFEFVSSFTETIEANLENDESILASFVDPSKDPQHYLDRYYNEPIYKEWFDKNYPELTIEKAVVFESVSSFTETIEANLENDIPKVVQRNHEIFQTIKAEQISLAEKKYQEILGGKTITNFPDDEPRKKIVYTEFKIDNQTGFMHRNHDDFQNYRLLQISIAEEFRDGSWKEKFSTSNPYQNNESIEVLSNNAENKILEQTLNYRQSEEFKNLIIEQIFLAENIRNEMLDFRMTGLAHNPYLDENVDENIDKNTDENTDKNTDELLGKTNTSIVISWSDLTYVIDKPEFNILDRNTKGFEMVRAMELEIAQNTLNKMLLLSNSEEVDVEIIILTNENKKLNNYERDDQGFEFFKNKSIDIAEKKLIEILGGKKIHNPDYLDFEIKKLYYLNLDKKE